MRTLKDIHEISGKRVLVRVDYNVPLEHGKVVDDNRIVESLETLRYLIDHQARIILLSHLGRPDGKRKAEFSLRPAAKRLKDLLLERGIWAPVRFCTETVGKEAAAMAEATKAGEILVLENLRFDGREEQNNPEFSAQLAKFGDLFIDDAFGTVHRAHASTVGVTKHLPGYAGLLVAKEVKELTKLRDHPPHPFIVILGGAKPDDKIALMKNLKSKVDFFLVGGGIADTFLKVKGEDIKKSLVGDDKALTVAKTLLSRIPRKVVLPVDYVWDKQAIVDVGPKTAKAFEAFILQAKTIFWNGTLGLAEEEQFAHGSKAIATAMAASKAYTVVGGGDTVTAVDHFKLREHIDFISTGGGATLEFLAGKSLPGLEVLED